MRREEGGVEYQGILPIYKEPGFTSHDVVAKLRGILHMKKIGHAGTLDPMASGVLPVCLGKGTKLSELLSDSGKSYRCVCVLGLTTDTEDLTGRILDMAREEALMRLSEERIRSVLESFIGGYEQVPPMYSAKKVNGKRLYALARDGRELERKPCPVQINGILLSGLFLSGNLPDVPLPPGSRRKKEEFLPDPALTAGRRLPFLILDVDCGKGTYIRSLCRDIGAALQTGGTMACLERTRAGGFSLEDSITLTEAEDCRKAGKPSLPVRSLESVFMDLPLLSPDAELDRLIRNGNPFLSEAPPGRYRVRLSDGTFAALYDVQNHRAKLCRYFLT